LSEAAYEVLSTNWDKQWDVSNPYGDDTPRVPVDLGWIEKETQKGKYFNLHY